MSKGQDIIDLAFDLVLYNQSVKYDVYNILNNFLNDPEQLDLHTILALEFLLNDTLIFFPTENELRKMKLKKINSMYENEEQKKRIILTNDTW